MTGRNRGVAAALALAACAAPGDPGTTPPKPATAAATTPAPPRAAPLTDAAAQDTLARVIAETELTTLRRPCYVFEPVDPARYHYRAREVHDARCGGAPETAPRLFDIRLDTATGAVLSDVNAVVRGDDGQDGAGMDTVRRPRGAPRP